MRVFHQHGIPLGASANNVLLSVETPLQDPVAGGEWKIEDPLELTIHTKPIVKSGRFQTRGSSSAFSPNEGRLLWFTEQKSNWKLPLGDTQLLQGVAVEKNMIHVVTTSPAVMYSIDVEGKRMLETHLDQHLDAGFYRNQSKLKVASLKDGVLVFDPEVL